MKLRVNNKWSNKNKVRSVEDTGSVLSFNLWKVGGENILHLENEGFQTDTYNQRLDVIAELSAFYIHVIDRMLSAKDYTTEKRQALITALALNLAKTMHDNRRDYSENKDKDYQGMFIHLLNERMTEYANFSFDGELDPGFQVKRRVGEYVRDVMGEKDNKWIPDQIIEIEIPDAMKAIKRITRGML